MNLYVRIWRRGRGPIAWIFRYVSESDEKWFTSPGWYHFTGRKNVYRLTIDHDYPDKPIWIGLRKRGKWVSMEGLYEPLFIEHRNFCASNKIGGEKRARRSHFRNAVSGSLIHKINEAVLNTTYEEI